MAVECWETRGSEQSDDSGCEMVSIETSIMTYCNNPSILTNELNGLSVKKGALYNHKGLAIRLKDLPHSYHFQEQSSFRQHARRS